MATTENTPTDDEIVGMLRSPAKRDDGFRLLMARHGRSLYWHIRRTVVGRDDADDVLQETCIKALTAIGDFRGEPHQIRAWLFRIATREALQHLRRQTRLFQSIDSLSDTLCERLRSENPVDGNHAEALLQEALLKLPNVQRLVFNLRYYDEMSYEEMAVVTGKSVGTLKTSYHYAAERVRQYIDENAE